MSKIPHCERCRQSFIDEELDGHDCSPITIALQEIGIDRMYGFTTNKNGDKVHLAKGLNGIIYRFVECRHNPPHTSTDQTKFDNPETNRRFYRTKDGSDFYVMNVYYMHDFKRFYKKTWPKNSKRSKSGPQKHGIGF